MTIRRFSPLSAPIFALATFAAAITAISCTDLTGVPASLPTLTDSGVVYAINGAPLGAPTALQISTGQLVPASSRFAFDIAFDIDSAGHVLFMPPERSPLRSRRHGRPAVTRVVRQPVAAQRMISRRYDAYRRANVTSRAVERPQHVRVGSRPEPVRQGHREAWISRRADEGRVHRRSELEPSVVRRRAQPAHARARMLREWRRSAARWARCRGALDGLAPVIDRGIQLERDADADPAVEERKARNANSQKSLMKAPSEDADELIARADAPGDEITKPSTNWPPRSAISTRRCSNSQRHAADRSRGDETQNGREWVAARADGVKPHWEIGASLGMIDLERGEGFRLIVLSASGRAQPVAHAMFMDTHRGEHGYEEVYRRCSSIARR
jgi:hypothetical protein